MCAPVYVPNSCSLNRTGCPAFTKLDMIVVPWRSCESHTCDFLQSIMTASEVRDPNRLPGFYETWYERCTMKVMRKPYLRLPTVNSDSVGGARHCNAGERQLPPRAVKLCIVIFFFNLSFCVLTGRLCVAMQRPFTAFMLRPAKVPMKLLKISLRCSVLLPSTI